MSLPDLQPAPSEQATSARPAEVDRRFLALIVDRVIGWGAVAGLAWACWHFLVAEDRAVLGWSLLVAGAALVGLAFALGTGLRGITPGKALLGLRVVKEGSGTPIGVTAALLRGLILLAATLPLGFGMVMIAWSAVVDSTRQRRGFHDVITGSVVLDVRPEPVADDTEEDDAPRHVVNLTAMRLRPAPAPAAAPARRASDAVGRAQPEQSRSQQQPGRQQPGQPGQLAGQRFVTPAPSNPVSSNPVSSNAVSSHPASPPTAPSGPGRRRRDDAGQQPRQQPGQQRPVQPGQPQPGQPQPGQPQPGQQGRAPQQPTYPPQQPQQRSAQPGQPGKPPAQQRPPQGGDRPAPTSPHHVRTPGTAQAPGDSTRAGGPVTTWRVTFDSGESFVVTGLVLVGRKPEARGGEQVAHLVPLRSSDMSVSKTHAQVHLSSEGALVVMDRGSTNGSYLHRGGVARELTPGRAATLLDGDTVRFGDREMRVSRQS